MAQEEVLLLAHGRYVPQRVLSNQDLERMVDTSDEWIVSRTGIKERRIAAKEESTFDLAFKACEQLIADSKARGEALDLSSIDLVLCATMSPDYVGGSIAARLQAALRLEGAAGFDLSAACSGWIYALHTAKAFIRASMARAVLVVGSEKMSAFIDYQDRSTCVLFGDGASAALVTSALLGHKMLQESAGKAKGAWTLQSSRIYSDGRGYETIYIPGGGAVAPAREGSLSAAPPYLHMRGPEVFKGAILAMEQVALEVMALEGLGTEEIDYFVAHQANDRIITALARRLEIPLARCVRTIEHYGNTSAASIGLAFDPIFKKENFIGSKALLTSYGAGVTWGGMLLKFLTLDQLEPS